MNLEMAYRSPSKDLIRRQLQEVVPRLFSTLQELCHLLQLKIRHRYRLFCTNINSLSQNAKLVIATRKYLIAQLQSALLLVHEVWGSITWPVKSDTRVATARHRCDVSSESCC